MNPIEEKYQANLDYLYTFVDYSLTRNLQYSPEKFNLERMRTLVGLLGNPQTEYPIIHVAGTKGKGSTAAMISSILAAADYRTGFYISPHLQDYAERIQVNQTPIPHGAFNHLVENIRPLVEKVGQLTTFEISTALGFEAFREQNVDVAVIEVGLGGRLDSTNIVNPVLSVITSLSMDHMNVLGDTLEKIAAEKAGIIKPGVTVISAPQRANALTVLEATAARQGSRFILVERNLVTRLLKHSLDGQWFTVRIPPTPLLDEKSVVQGGQNGIGLLDEKSVVQGGQNGTGLLDEKSIVQGGQNGTGLLDEKSVVQGGQNGTGFLDEKSIVQGGQKSTAGKMREYLSPDYSEEVDYFIPLLGRHQVDNAATAILAVLELRRQGFEISDQAIQEGLSNVVWPCRFEVLQRKPPIVVDSAHNRDSALKLRKAMEDYFPGKPITLIFGASEDKDISGMYAELLPACSRLIVTRSTHPRAAELNTLIKSAEAYSCALISADTVEIALDFSLDPGEHNGVILAAGSLFIASAVRAAWQERAKGVVEKAKIESK